MDDLIEALTILRKYSNLHYPIHCEHDTLYVVGVDPSEVSEEDTLRLDELGFLMDEYASCLYSYRFGSA